MSSKIICADGIINVDFKILFYISEYFKSYASFNNFNRFSILTIKCDYPSNIVYLLIRRIIQIKNKLDELSLKNILYICDFIEEYQLDTKLFSKSLKSYSQGKAGLVAEINNAFKEKIYRAKNPYQILNETRNVRHYSFLNNIVEYNFSDKVLFSYRLSHKIVKEELMPKKILHHWRKIIYAGGICRIYI